MAATNMDHEHNMYKFVEYSEIEFHHFMSANFT